MRCIEETLDLCHTNSSLVDILSDNLQDFSRLGSLPQLDNVPKCHICTKQVQSSREIANCLNQEVHRNGKSEKIGESNHTEKHSTLMKITSDDDLAVVWQSICYHIHTHVCKELTTKPCFLILEDNLMKKSLWQLYLNVLRVLFTPEQVQKTHGHVRTQQLTNMTCPCLPTDCCLRCLCEFCIENLIEDVSFLSMGYFCPLVVTWQELQATYLAHIQTYVGKLLAKLDDAILLHNTNQRTNVSGMGSHSKSLHCLVDPEKCRSQNFSRQTNKQQDGNPDKPTFSFQQKESGFYTKPRRRNNVMNKSSDWLLNAVLQLVEELFWLDQQLHCIYCVETCLENDGNSSYTVLNGGQFSLASNSPTISPVYGGTKIAWDWRSTLTSHGVLTMLQRGIQNSGSSTGLQIPVLKQQVVVPATPVDIDNAKISVFAFANNSVCHLERFLSVLSASQGSFSPFHASFSHAVHVHLTEVLDILNSIITTQDGSIDVLYVANNTVEYLERCITTFGNSLLGKTPYEAKESENGLKDLKKRTSMVSTEIQQLIVAHHLKWLSGCVLQDSHDKSFYEGNRISFSIQALHLYLQSISWDMFSYLPTLRAQQLVAEILCFLLEQMCFRYAMHTKMFVADIKMLLLCTYDTLFCVCRSRRELIGSRDLELQSDERAYNIEAIHSHCTALLAAVCIRSVPLEKVYQVFDYPSQYPWMTHCSPWLMWLFPVEEPSATIWLSFRLATALPRPNAPALVRALTTQGCTLAIMLFSEIAKKSATYDATSEAIRHFSDALFRTFVQCIHVPDCLADVLVPAIESLDGWKQFDTNAMTEPQRSWWLKSLQILLAPYIQSIIASSALTIVTLTRYKEADVSWNEVKCQLESLYTPGEQEKSCSIFCLAEILSCARDLIPMFPVPIMHCLARLEFHVQSTSVRPFNECLGFQVLLSTLYDHLRSKDDLQLTFGTTLDPATLSTCSNLADLLAYGMLSGTPACRNHLGSVTEQVDIITHIFRENRNNVYASDTRDGECKMQHILEEEGVALAIESLMQTSHGHAAIESLHTVLINNQGWIQSSLGIAPIFPHSVTLPKFHLDTQRKGHLNPLKSETLQDHTCGTFNPLRAYREIEGQIFTQECLLNYVLDEEKLLPHLAAAGITETNFRSLLCNRWELRASNPVQSSLKK